jgi:predicted adenine nucleotide alpha hydrolase (AANH) superfamily ATPase
MDDVNKIGREIAVGYGIIYSDINWRKGGLEERRKSLEREKNLYTQKYCGCRYSRRDLLKANEEKKEYLKQKNKTP